MSFAQVGLLGAAIVAALLLAWWPWRGALTSALHRLAFAARATAILAVLLLILDPGVRTAVARRQPLVLLDNSVSMHAATGLTDSARALATTLGEVVPFGEAAPGQPGGRSDIGSALAAAAGSGRPIEVITDGEIADIAAVPADLLAQASVRLLPRGVAPDVAISEARLPSRLAAGDTLTAEIDLRAANGWRDSVRVEVRDGDRVLLAGPAGFAGSSDRAVLRLEGPLPAGLDGERWLTIAIAGVTDAEPRDDQRLRRVVITPSPGVVVIAARADWDARFLYRTLAEVTATPVRGFVQLQPGQWRRMDNLKRVTGAEVLAAARRADLVAVRGDTTPYSGLGRARMFWPGGGTAGDWYLSTATASPLAGAFAGLDPDSLPPVSAASSVPDGDWIALTARLARRGAELPVVSGREAGGRTVVIGVEGLHRWAFGGGEAEQAWRTMVANAAAWLLAAPETGGPAVRPVTPVVEWGEPLRFRYQGSAAPAPMAIALAGDSATVSDTLRFDADGIAAIVVPPGRYRYRLGGAANDAGTVAVERFADELLPAPVTLGARTAIASPVPARRSLRELLPLFAIAVLGFALEWVVRRRVGMR